MRTGWDRLLDEPKRWLGKARVGLVANPTTVDRRLAHAIDLLHGHPDIDLRLLFGPEHGIRGAAQDMIGVGGARYYPYAATMALCMRAAKKSQVKVVVLDRPNPIGGVQFEGGGLDPGLESFCGLYPIPQRHALTVGELARLYNDAFGIGCDLEVVACQGWRRRAYYDECDLSWVMPSPNMPTLETAVVYPGMCLLESTNLSEGRGTTRPFALFAAS